jgi:hypothetical protein
MYVLLILGTCHCTVYHSKDLTSSEKNACKLFTVRSMFFESRAPVWMPIARSQEAVPIHHFFANGDKVACVYHCNPSFQQHVNICTLVLDPARPFRNQSLTIYLGLNIGLVVKSHKQLRSFSDS